MIWTAASPAIPDSRVLGTMRSSFTSWHRPIHSSSRSTRHRASPGRTAPAAPASRAPPSRSGQGDAAPPFEPPASRAAGAAGGRGRRPPNPVAGALIAERRTVMVAARVSPTELADWQVKAGPLACRCRRCSGRPWRARGCGPPRRPRGSVSVNPAERAFACHSARSA